MDRNNTSSGSGNRQKIAYHEAGHAAAIYLNNNLKNLPPVFFQILFENIGGDLVEDRLPSQRGGVAMIDGGRLILSLPLAVDELNDQSRVYTAKKVSRYTDDYLLAFEADIVNLLVGPLAEAKYCCQRDNEPFSQQLIAVQALKNYGGATDLAVVNDYLQSYSANKQQQNKLLMRLFSQAFSFVNTYTNWKAITHLANYILASNKNVIGYHEVTGVFDRQ
jgi:hypothetical protein